jgi:hypothetical protein
VFIAFYAILDKNPTQTEQKRGEVFPKNYSRKGGYMNIKGLKRPAVLAALYNASKPQGMGFMHYDPKPMTEEEAEKILNKVGTNFDYFKGRVMKIDLSKDEVNTGGYNRDNGPDAAEKAVAELVKSNQVITPAIVSTHIANTIAAAADVMGHIHEETTFSVEGGTAAIRLGLSDMAPYLRPAIKRAEKSLRKPIKIAIKLPAKTTFRPLARGRFKCNQTGVVVKAGQTRSYANRRAMSAG